MVVLLDDDTVRARLDAASAVRWMGEAVDAQHRGELAATARVHAGLGGGELAFTAGRSADGFGYRSYARGDLATAEQVVVVHDAGTGRVRAVAVGQELGPRRTGALGAVAVDALARHGAEVLALIGTGTQALTQLWAIAAVRPLREVRVFSRDPGRRTAFAGRAVAAIGEPAGVRCRAVDHPRDAVEGAAVVVLATDSPTPVLDPAWIDPGTCVTTLGPKQRGRAEFDLALLERATLLVTDSVEQVDAYDPPNVLVGTPHRDRLVSLCAVRAGEVRPVGPGDVPLFCSVGLAGTEMFLLGRLTQS